MIILTFFAVILAFIFKSSNGFQHVRRMPLSLRSATTDLMMIVQQQEQLRRQQSSLVVLLDAVAPLSENDTDSSLSSPSPSWDPSNGFRVEGDDSADVLVNDSTTAAATAVSSLSVHSSTTATTTTTTSHSQEKKENKIAVILNMNARGVTESTAETVRKVLTSSSSAAAASENKSSSSIGRVFVTRTAQEATDAATDIISDSSYKLVIPVGGDGTLTTVINSLVSAIRRRQQRPDLTTCTVSQAIQQMPVLGYIPLGTGNGVGPVVGCKLKRRFRRRKQKEEIESLFAELQKASESLFLNVNNDSDGSDSSSSGSSSSTASTIIKLPIMEVTINNEKTEEDNVLCFFAGGMRSNVAPYCHHRHLYLRFTGVSLSHTLSMFYICVRLPCSWV
jgi:Diacylglycerol kinase catalytic domain